MELFPWVLPFFIRSPSIYPCHWVSRSVILKHHRFVKICGDTDFAPLWCPFTEHKWSIKRCCCVNRKHPFAETLKHQKNVKHPNLSVSGVWAKFQLPLPAEGCLHWKCSAKCEIGRKTDFLPFGPDGHHLSFNACEMLYFFVRDQETGQCDADAIDAP